MCGVRRLKEESGIEGESEDEDEKDILIFEAVKLNGAKP